MTGLETTLGPTLMLAWTPSLWEIIMILIVGLLLFGRRLPEVGRSLGKSIVEFKKGLKDVKTDIDVESAREDGDRARISAHAESMPRARAEADKAKASGE